MLLNGFREALRILTIIPVSGTYEPNISHSLPYFPVTGALLGSVCAGVAWLVGNGIGWVTAAGVLATATDAVLTGAIHLDGLADVADSLGGSIPEERHRIMKDPHVGTYGIVTVVLVLFLRAVSFAKLAEAQKWLWYMIPFVISRAVMALSAGRMKYARENGNLARQLVENSTYLQIIFASIISAILCFLIGGMYGVMLLIAGYGIAFVSWGWMNRRYGGITGDLIGMLGITTETIVLMFLAFLVSLEGGLSKIITN